MIAPRTATLRLPTKRLGTMRSVAPSLTLKLRRRPRARLSRTLLVESRTELRTGATLSLAVPAVPPVLVCVALDSRSWLITARRRR